MNNLNQAWTQGYFVEQAKYTRWTQAQKDQANEDEKHNVRPYPTGNAIARCNNPDSAKWIADRLNLASKLEQMTYDFATGKTDGSEITKLVMEVLNS